MMTSERTDDLGFSEVAKQSFAFLLEYGFALIEEVSSSVRYTSPVVSALVYQERYSKEMYLRLSLLNTAYVADLSEIADYANAPEANAFHERNTFTASTADDIRKLVPEMARLLRNYGELFLNGNVEAYKQVELARDEASAKWSLEMNLREIRAKVDRAWRDQQYKQVAALLAPVRQHIKPSDFKKLEIAERKMGGQ